LLLKTKRIAVQSHPVVRRLYQYRQLLKQLKPVDELMTPQMESILELIHNGDEITPMTSKKTNHMGNTK
jgi:U3 small nucleolar RNA-associated protein 3